MKRKVLVNLLLALILSRVPPPWLGSSSALDSCPASDPTHPEVRAWYLVRPKMSTTARCTRNTNPTGPETARSAA